VLLWRTVENADIRVLPMIRFNPSGDLKWLGPNYRPQRDVRLIADEDAGLSPRVRAQIREIRGSARSPRLKIGKIGRDGSAV